MKEILSNVDQALDEEIGALAEEFNARLRRGEKPSAQEYAEEYPHLAELILSVFPALEIMGATVTREPSSNSNVGAKPGVLGDYHIICEAGRGGMGVVYEAQQISLDRRVALKVLPFAAVLDERQIKRFHNEARAAAQLKHANIVQVYGVGCERSVHFYAMEFVKGETLESAIKSMRNARAANSYEVPDDEEDSTHAETILNATSQRASKDAAIATGKTIRDADASLSNGVSSETSAFFQAVARIGADVADALDHAHVEGVVHRDIKPSNLMLDSRGKVWVTDFGLARIETDAGVTMTGDLLGTMRYMSPEQALAHRVVIDHRTDVYSLGVTLYELLALRPAFPQQEQQELLKQIAFEGPPRIKKLNPHVPQDLATIVGKAVERNPNDRYATAKAMADDLRRFLERRPINARPPRVVDIVAKWSRRHWKPIAATLAAILLVAVTGMVMLGRNRDLLAEANSSLAAANMEMEATNNELEASSKELEALVHYTAGQYFYEKGDLKAAYNEIREAVNTADRWEYGYQLAKICESARRWLPVARIAVDQSPDWVRIASHDPDGRDEYIILRIGSRLEVHSIREGRRVGQLDLREQEDSATVDVLVTRAASNTPGAPSPRLVHLNRQGQLSLLSLPHLQRMAPAFTSKELKLIPSIGQLSYVRLAADETGSRIAVPLARQIVVLDTSDSDAVSTLETFEAERDVEFVRLSPKGSRILFQLRDGYEGYVKNLLESHTLVPVPIWDYCHFLDDDRLLGVRYHAAGSFNSQVNVFDLSEMKEMAQWSVHSLSFSYLAGKQDGFRVRGDRFQRTEMSRDFLTVITGATDMRSAPSTSLVRAADLMPHTDVLPQLLCIHPGTMTIVAQHGSELVAFRQPQIPATLSRRKVDTVLWNSYQHKGELFVNSGRMGTSGQFAIYNVANFMNDDGPRTSSSPLTFRLTQPTTQVEGRYFICYGITMNSTPKGDRLAVLWGEVDVDTMYGKVYRLAAYVYDKADVAKADGEVEPVARVPLTEVGEQGKRVYREFALAPHGSTILVCINHGIFAYDTKACTLRYRTEDLFPDRLPRAFAVSPDQTVAASGDPYDQHTVKVWDVEQGTVIFETKKKKLLQSIAFDRNGKNIWIGWRSGSVDVHRLPDGQLVKSFESAPAPKFISPREDRYVGTRTMSRGNYGTRELVDNHTGAAVSGMVFEQYWHILNKGWYSPDGSVLAMNTKYSVSLYNSILLDAAEQFLSKTFPLEMTLPPEADDGN